MADPSVTCRREAIRPGNTRGGFFAVWLQKFVENDEKLENMPQKTLAFCAILLYNVFKYYGPLLEVDQSPGGQKYG
jgi:hypothetical protein